MVWIPFRSKKPKRTLLTQPQQIGFAILLVYIVLPTSAIYAGVFHENSNAIAIIKILVGTILLIMPAYIAIRMREGIRNYLIPSAQPDSAQRQHQDQSDPKHDAEPHS